MRLSLLAVMAGVFAVGGIGAGKSHAAWVSLGTYGVSGIAPMSYTGTTQNGANISFTLASDCVQCGSSQVCYQLAQALVEYEETFVAPAMTEVDVRLSYAGGPSSVHWWDVSVQGLVPVTNVVPDICGPQWGYQGAYPCIGTCYFRFLDPSLVSVGDAPRVAGVSLGLGGNPLGPGASLRIGFSLPRRSRATLRIVNVAGARVATLADAEVEAGAHVITWDGRIDLGPRAPAGVYFLSLDAAGQRRTASVVILH